MAWVESCREDAKERKFPAGFPASRLTGAAVPPIASIAGKAAGRAIRRGEWRKGHDPAPRRNDEQPRG